PRRCRRCRATWVGAPWGRRSSARPLASARPRSLAVWGLEGDEAGDRGNLGALVLDGSSELAWGAASGNDSYSRQAFFDCRVLRHGPKPGGDGTKTPAGHAPPAIKARHAVEGQIGVAGLGRRRNIRSRR